MTEHVGKLVENVGVSGREHRAECSCGWVGPTFFGRGSAARPHDQHLRDVSDEQEQD